MSKQVAIVTGANRGMGLETVRQLATLGYQAVLTSRDRDKGLAAVEELHRDGLDVDYHPLDVDKPEDIQVLARYIKESYGGLYILVNNAGIVRGSFAEETSIFKADADSIVKTFRTNTIAPLLLIQALVPLMKGEGRIVNVSSGMGQLSDMNGGYADYRLSKVALNAVTRICNDELQGTDIKINSVCPGWVRTDMGGEEADRPVEKGVETTVWLATLPKDGPSGGFFRDKKSIPW